MTDKKASKGQPVFGDGTEGARDFREHPSRAPRKTLQLCEQVRRALELTMLGDVGDRVLQDLSVESVQPAPDDSRLLILFTAHGDAATRSKPAVLMRLEAARPILLAEVARTINRSKLPELAFEILRDTAN